jgi:hypothetical protein
VRLDAMQLHQPRQWGACWLACRLYEQLGLDHFWQARLPDSREGTRWRHILQTLVVYRLLDPGSEWRAASRRALPIGATSFKSLESILKHGFDAQAPLNTETRAAEPLLHPNLRGAQYYH